MKGRLAVGHDPSLNPASNWDIPTLAGAGALRSTVNDLLTFLAANLGYRKTSLAAAMAAEVSIRKPTGAPGLDIAYGWHILTGKGSSIIWHNGGTGGYRTYMGFDQKTGIGVVVLSNTSTNEGPDDIGRHLLNPNYPLLKIEPPKEHREAEVDTKVFDRYVGRYEMAPDFILSITRDADHLYAQATGQGRFEIFPEGETEFFAKIADIQITFKAGDQGLATELVVHQMGRNTPAKRLGGEPEKPQ